MQHQIESRFREIEQFINKACSSDVPEEVQGYLFKFGTVMICGNIERAIEIVVLDRLINRAQPRVLRFVKSYFQRGTNFDCTAIEQLLNRFDPDWYRVFHKFVEENLDIKEGVSSCYAVRNSVAHGGTAAVGSKGLRDFFNASRRLIEGVIFSTQ